MDSKCLFFVSMMAVATASWGLVDIGNSATSKVFFDALPTDLPAFLPALLRFLLAIIVLLSAIFIILAGKSSTRIVLFWLLMQSSGRDFLVRFWLNQMLYGLIWGAAITCFVAAFQFTGSGEFVFISCLCGFAIFQQLSERCFDDKFFAIIAFNGFILAFYIYGASFSRIFLPGKELLLMGSVLSFIVFYHFSFEFKRKLVLNDDALTQECAQMTGYKQTKFTKHFLQLFKLTIQFSGAGIIAFLSVQLFAILVDGSFAVIPDLVYRASYWTDIEFIYDLLLVVIYIGLATVGSYFLFNIGLEGLNRKRANTIVGTQAAAFLSSLEPLTACLIALLNQPQTMSEEPGTHLFGSIIAFLLYMAYLYQVHKGDRPLYRRERKAWTRDSFVLIRGCRIAGSPEVTGFNSTLRPSIAVAPAPRAEAEISAGRRFPASLPAHLRRLSPSPTRAVASSSGNSS